MSRPSKSCPTAPATCMGETDANALDRADMERLIAGQDAALNCLMERHAAPVFHFLCRMVGNEDDANDLAQETFTRVFRARASFRLNEKFSTQSLPLARAASERFAEHRNRRPRAIARKYSSRPGRRAERANTRRRARRRGPQGSFAAGRRFARSHCALRMGGPQHGRSRYHPGDHAESHRIPPLPRPQTIARTFAGLAVSHRQNGFKTECRPALKLCAMACEINSFARATASGSA